jgi:hypothetical protein
MNTVSNKLNINILKFEIIEEKYALYEIMFTDFNSHDYWI